MNGGGFLLEAQTPEEILTPEDLTPEHRAIAKATEEFWAGEVVPVLEELQHNPVSAVNLLRKSAEIGLTAVVVPERFGGMEMDLTSMMVVAQKLGADGSYGTCHGAHTGIGTFPILLFGSEEQKRKYLPKLASAETIAAYALTEPQAGSDALAARTRADLAPDGSHYVLNGQKMWITNGGFAGLYVVFAKIGGEKFTAFLVERGWPGVSTGPDEKKMGLKGSSTTAVYFDNVRVPVENVLGEIGRGHIIAFNILNLGRLTLAAGVIGGCCDTIAVSIRYAKQRKAFGKCIAEFGMIRHKLAEMAVRTFAAESMVYRVIGSIERRLAGFSWEAADAPQTMLKAVEEYAAECSFAKIFASEALDYVVDEGVQIHGGYGYHQDYAVERAYCDSRINRIFEGTNEINRLLATGMLLKRAQRGALPLMDAVEKLQQDIRGRLAADSEDDLISNAKNIGIFLLAVAYHKYGNAIEEQQEIIANITDVLMSAYAMESVSLRTRKMAAAGKHAQNASEMALVFAEEAIDTISEAATAVLAACSEGDMLRTNLAVLRRFTKHDPPDTIGLRRRIAARLIETERYIV
jgi:alkylation response protein AidB-like acyl-CoA dehydrogenase